MNKLLTNLKDRIRENTEPETLAFQANPIGTIGITFIDPTEDPDCDSEDFNADFDGDCEDCPEDCDDCLENCWSY